MSVRALAVLASLLGLLLLGVLGVGGHRLGWLAASGAEPLCFVNYTLTADTRQVTEVHPLHPEIPRLRYMVDHVETDPDVTEGEPLYAGAHAVIVSGVKRPEDPDFSPLPNLGALALDHLGSLTMTEWLIEIRNAVERGDEGDRDVVVATFRNSDGSVRRYFFDPEWLQLPFGWYRMEVNTPDGGRQDYLAVSRVDPAALADRIPKCRGIHGGSD
jgi:hypothetical protein